MSPEEKDGVRRMVIETVARLQRSSTSPNHVGAQYARLINLLWRRPPKQTNEQSTKKHNGVDSAEDGQHPASQPVVGLVNGTMPLPTFSWLDLDSVGNFAAQNNSDNGVSPSYTDFSFIPEGLGPGPVVALPDGVDSQQWFNDNTPSYVF